MSVFVWLVNWLTTVPLPYFVCPNLVGWLPFVHLCVFVWTPTTDADYWNDVRELEPLEQRIKCWNLMMKYAAGQRSLDVGETACVCVCVWECICEYGHVECVRVLVYNSFITLSAAAYTKPQRIPQWFRVGPFCRETEQPYRENTQCENTQLICKRHFNMCVSWIRLW